MTFWTTCERGHDLTLPDAYVYFSGGTRRCRQCAEADQAKPKKRHKFELGQP